MEKQQLVTIGTIILAVISIIYVIGVNIVLSDFKIQKGPPGKAGKKGDDAVNITCSNLNDKKKCLA